MRRWGADTGTGGPSIPDLWFLITEPDADSFQCVIANVTTLRSHCDRTLVLQKGEHPFIRHPSLISFADARIADARQMYASGKPIFCVVT